MRGGKDMIQKRTAFPFGDLLDLPIFHGELHFPVSKVFYPRALGQKVPPFTCSVAGVVQVHGKCPRFMHRLPGG